MQAMPREDREASTRFPSNVMSSLRTVITVPSNIDVEDAAFPVCMRFRLQDLPEAQCRRVRMTDFTVDIEQTEQCRYVHTPIDSIYSANHTLPGRHHRLSTKPLFPFRPPQSSPLADPYVTLTPRRRSTTSGSLSSRLLTTRSQTRFRSSRATPVGNTRSRAMVTCSRTTRRRGTARHGSPCARRSLSTARDAVRRRARAGSALAG